jgi:hypothetical protein
MFDLVVGWLLADSFVEGGEERGEAQDPQGFSSPVCTRRGLLQAQA